MMARLSIVIGLVAGIAVAALLLGGIYALTPDDAVLPSAQPTAPTATPSSSPSPSASIAPSPSTEASPAASPSPSVVVSPSPGPSVVVSPSPSASASIVVSPSASPSAADAAFPRTIDLTARNGWIGVDEIVRRGALGGSVRT